ncbi:MAG TPA: leucine--tRNA ligase [Patescibacteria group bacterium]
MSKYEPSEIEPKWQAVWRKNNLYKVDLSKSARKFYLLVEFTYPSGDLHMGHWFTFAVPDILARMKRMQGFEVFAPNGFDAFGLPAENAAIKRGIHPQDWTLSHVKRMKEQFATMGASYDWTHEVITCLPNYYKWNQWIFIKMYELGLAYRGKSLSNWCPLDRCVLANENVENGKCWRCGSEVVQKEIDQWFLKITDYAERLIWPDKSEGPERSRGKETVDWPKSLIEGQNNWIGKSEGATIEFRIKNAELRIPVFTTRPDTLFGATFLVLAPEHPLVKKLTTKEYQNLVKEYQKRASQKSEVERKVGDKDKSGIWTGSYAINPVNNESIPIYTADYVLMGYGTGAIMAVPAHDQRDFEFAKKHNLEIRQVIRQLGSKANGQNATKIPTIQVPNNLSEAFEGPGILINSGKYNNLHSKEASAKIISDLEKVDLAVKTTNYHIHDWSVSRQRYWGTPIPIIYCRKCWSDKGKVISDKSIEGRDYAIIDGEKRAIVPVPLDQLPVELPYEVDYTPKGRAPLATAEDWVNVKCPSCGGEAKRDTETMDGFVDSSWYFIRYLDPQNDKKLADTKLIYEWLPVDIYFGGAEHTLGHTMYSRFFTKFLHDIGIVPFVEYAQKRVHHGVILGPDGSRMSKSKGNVVNPDVEVAKFGADAVRIYLAFLGPYDLVTPWNPGGINGVYRYLQRVWALFQVESGTLPAGRQEWKVESELSAEDLRQMHKTIKKVSVDVENIKFNTAVAALMEWLNYLSDKSKERQLAAEEVNNYLRLLAPFAPHLAEELWDKLGFSNGKSIHLANWPQFDPKLIQSEKVLIIVQINGKVRDKIEVEADLGEDELKRIALDSEKIKIVIGKSKIQKSIVVPNRLVNIVI